MLVVGEAPGEHEDRVLKAFVGPSGQELDRQLAEAGFVTSACRFTNAIKYRPRDDDADLAFAWSKKAALENQAVSIQGRWCLPVAAEGLRELQEEIARVQPKLIICVGATALWAVTGKEGIDNWRGSALSYNGIPVVPTYHPALILRVWGNRYLCIHDLKKAHKVLLYGPEDKPLWRFVIRPNYETVMQYLDICEAQGTLAVDIETKQKQIVCVGIGWSQHDAICIPFIDRFGNPYWSEEEELAIVARLQHILVTHKIVGHNFHYDAQYFARKMLVVPTCYYDTMLAQHVLFPGTSKDLAHCSSLYCPYHVFWKDDGKEWDPKIHTEEQLWAYNCTDCVKTFEVMEAQQVLLEKYKLQPQMAFMMEVWPHILLTMLIGVRVNPEAKAVVTKELDDAIEERKKWLEIVIGRPFNPKSSPQMKLFFVDELGVKVRKGKKTKGISFDKKAMQKIADEHILLWPIIQVMTEIKSLRVFRDTFAKAALDDDGRMRCSYNQGGVETFRLSSSENAFGTGTNLQNIPDGKRSTTMSMPNMRKLFIPDEDMEIADIDLAGADAQIVAWEADDRGLKAAFRAGLKIHVVNNKEMYGHLAGPDGKAEPYYTRIKQGVHLTNYCGKAPTMASTLGLKVAECEAFQAKWFSLHPNIPRWHASIDHELTTTRTVKNIWGFRRVYFDRINTILPQAVAWKPQSSIAIVTNKIWVRLGTEPGLPVQVLLQTHDSLTFQYPIARREEVLRRVKELVKIRIPYPDPLIIGLGLKTSTESWGACVERKWPEDIIAA